MSYAVVVKKICVRPFMIRGMRRQPSNGDLVKQRAVRIADNVICIYGNLLKTSTMRIISGILKLMSLSPTFLRMKSVIAPRVQKKIANEQSCLFLNQLETVLMYIKVE